MAKHRSKPSNAAAQPAKAAKRAAAAERAAAERAAAERALRRRTMRNRAVAVVAVLALGGVVLGLVVRARRHSAQLVAALTSGSCRLDSRADADSGAGANHVPDPTFRVDPPSGGNHDPAPASAGIYDDPVPSDGKIVHAMEHGYVILWHRPDLSAADRRLLDDVAGRFRTDVLMVARPSLAVPVAATAWHHRLLCGQIEASPLARFVDTYRNQGPEKVPHR